MTYTINNPKVVGDYNIPSEDHWNFNGVVINLKGDIAYYENGKRHREDGIAVILINNALFYYCNGQLHRDDGPAIIKNDLSIYMQRNKYHRTDGPAVIYANGSVEYWINDSKLKITKNEGLANYLIHHSKL